MVMRVIKELSLLIPQVLLIVVGHLTVITHCDIFKLKIFECVWSQILIVHACFSAGRFLLYQLCSYQTFCDIFCNLLPQIFCILFCITFYIFY